MLSKILKREVILPRFHCYIGEPASCFLDVLFDPISLSSLSFLENSFLSTCEPPLPKACEVSLREVQDRMMNEDEQLLESVLGEFFAKVEECEFVELKFPEPGDNGFHLSLSAFPDR